MQIDRKEIERLIDIKMETAGKTYGEGFKSSLIEILSLERMLAPQSGDTPNRYIPVTKWKDYHPYPTEAALRMLIFKGEENGFNSVVVHVGKRVLIDEKAYFEWLDTKKTIAEFV